MRRSFCASVFLLILAAGCSKPTDPWSDEYIKYDLEHRGPAEIRKLIDQTPYTPPADGRLTRQQVENALKAFELGIRIRKATLDSFDQNVRDAQGVPMVGGFAGALTTVVAARNVDLANVRAAISLGMNPAEHVWVEKQVVTALSAGKYGSSESWAVADLKRRHDAAQSLVEKANLRNQMIDAERRLRERQRQTLPPGTLDNMKLLRAFQTEIDRIEQLAQSVR